MTTDEASWAPGLVAIRRLARVPPHQRPDRRPEARPARWDRPELDGQGHHRPDRGVRARRFVAPRLVRPARPAPAADPDAVAERERDGVDRSVTTTYLERLGGAVGRGRQRPVSRSRSRPGRAATRLLGRSGRRRAVRDAHPRGRWAVRGGREAEPGLLRSARIGRPGRPRAAPRPDPDRHPGGRWTPSAATSARPRPATPSRCSIGSARTPLPSAHMSAARRSARCSSAPTASRTSCAGPRTPVPASSRPSSSRPTRRSAPLPSRCTSASPDWSRAGVPAGRSAWSSERRLRRSWSRSGPPPPDSAILVPGVGAQGGEIEPVLRHGPATADPAGGRPGRGLLVNVSRGIAGAALGEPFGEGSSDPGERLAAAARDWASRLPVLP